MQRASGARLPAQHGLRIMHLEGRQALAVGLLRAMGINIEHAVHAVNVDGPMHAIMGTTGVERSKVQAAKVRAVESLVVPPTTSSHRFLRWNFPPLEVVWRCANNFERRKR